MKQLYTLLLLALFASTAAFAQTDSLDMQIQEIENSLRYQYGTVSLGSDNATLNVPKGFKYLDAEQAEYVLTELWGNPTSGTSLGMLLPENSGVLSDNTWVFDIEYDEIGYVKDNDAEDIDYADLLKEMQDEMLAGNSERMAAGYGSLQLIGWASQPYYDKENKILHWAKEIKFDDAEANTLNYNVRILGRKGVLVLNAIAGMQSLPEVQENIALVSNSITFDQGHSYFDFNPDVDDVAAWTIGSLVAGKVLAKVGFFALILKFWKIIAIAVAAGGSAVVKWFRRRKEGEPVALEEQQEPVTTQV